MRTERLGKSRDGLWLAVIVLLCLGVWAWVTTAGRSTFIDSAEYLAQAMNLRLHGSRYTGVWAAPFDWRFVSRRPPAYGALIAALQSLGATTAMITALQALAGAGIMAGIVGLLRRYGLKHAGSLLAVALVLSPTQLVMPSLVMTEMLLQACLVGALFCLIGYLEQPRSWLAWAHHGCLALAVLTKPVFLLFWLVAPLFWLWLWWTDRAKAAVLPASLLPLVTVLAVSQANYRQTGYWHYSTITTEVLGQWHARELVHATWPDEAAKRWDADMARLAVTPVSLAQSDRELRYRAIAVIRARPLAYLGLQLKGMVNFFLAPGRFEVSQATGIADPPGPSFFERFAKDGYRGAWTFWLQHPPWMTAYLMLCLAANGLILLAAVAGLGDGRLSLPIRLFSAGMVLYVCLLTGPIGAARFRMPVIPFLWLLAACGWDRLAHGGKPRLGGERS
jgi:4-amino-4-deoxy-L-arabinose transferase-like glycosyltransferase